MATHHFTLAAAVPLSDVTPGPASNAAVEAVLYPACKGEQGYVISNSRRGAAHSLLGAIAEAVMGHKGLFLFRNYALIPPAELGGAIVQMEEILTSLEESPSIVVEATKTKHEEETDLSCNGLDGTIKARIVYPENVCIREGWVYRETDASVRDALRNAQVSCNPRPAFDDDGESLQYALGLLKSHHALLQLASQREHAVLYAQLGEPWFGGASHD